MVKNRIGAALLMGVLLVGCSTEPNQDVAEPSTMTSNTSRMAPSATPTGSPVSVSTSALTPTSTPLSDQTLKLSNADIKALTSTVDYQISFSTLGQTGDRSVVGKVGSLHTVGGSNDFGREILPIFPMFDRKGNVTAPQVAEVTLGQDSFLVNSDGLVSIGGEGDPTYARYSFNRSSGEVTIEMVRVYHVGSGNLYKVPKGTELYTVYQRAVIRAVTAEAWDSVVSAIAEAIDQADAYFSYASNPDAVDKYGNPVEAVPYPRLSTWDLVEVLVDSREGDEGFSTETVITSPLGEGVVGTLAVNFADGTYSGFRLLSPSGAQALMNEVTTSCGWKAKPNWSASEFPTTASEAVRALNLAVHSARS